MGGAFGVHVLLGTLALERYIFLKKYIADSYLGDCYPDATPDNKGPLFFERFDKINVDDLLVMAIAHLICITAYLIRRIITAPKIIKEKRYKYC